MYAIKFTPEQQVQSRVRLLPREEEHHSEDVEQGNREEEIDIANSAGEEESSDLLSEPERPEAELLREEQQQQQVPQAAPQVQQPIEIAADEEEEQVQVTPQVEEEVAGDVQDVPVCNYIEGLQAEIAKHNEELAKLKAKLIVASRIQRKWHREDWIKRRAQEEIARANAKANRELEKLKKKREKQQDAGKSKKRSSKVKVSEAYAHVKEEAPELPVDAKN